MASDDRKKYCQTRIPADWPQFKAPTWTPGLTPERARRLWFEYCRSVGALTPNPRVYKS